ncbi:hypothetical protein DASB73_009720 [Starmerella bacillaris]|uniref:Uncharacterized protein n=1 Tax=Starmerella bacillaris TaxID=1247836 RepID=A0AAV5RHM7_STABA|nr:hypothetical protein DASB73_009720 [Starmerella bacillaris]
MRPRQTKQSRNNRFVNRDSSDLLSSTTTDNKTDFKPRRSENQNINSNLGITLNGNVKITDRSRRVPLLQPTYEETHGEVSFVRTSYGDPLIPISKKLDLAALKREVLAKLVVSAPSILGAAEHDIVPAQLCDVHTPMRRQADSISNNQVKKQRTMTHAYNGEEDVSLDTVQSVLRMVDESLMYTPERDTIMTPTILRAKSGPSPHQIAPAYAYDSSNFKSITSFIPQDKPALFRPLRL